MSNICTKSELPVYPFATQSSALLICSRKREKVREAKKQEKGEGNRERGGGERERGSQRSLSLTKKRSAGFTDCQHCWPPPPPLPQPSPFNLTHTTALPTCTFCSRISLAGSVARQRAVSIENSRGSTEKVVFAAKEAEREREGE